MYQYSVQCLKTRVVDPLVLFSWIRIQEGSNEVLDVLFWAVLGIRILRIGMILDLPDPLVTSTGPDPAGSFHPSFSMTFYLHPDPLVRGTDPRVRIRANMSRIPNTAVLRVWFRSPSWRPRIKFDQKCFFFFSNKILQFLVIKTPDPELDPDLHWPKIRISIETNVDPPHCWRLIKDWCECVGRRSWCRCTRPTSLPWTGTPENSALTTRWAINFQPGEIRKIC